jgi:hypothetical protein
MTQYAIGALTTRGYLPRIESEGSVMKSLLPAARSFRPRAAVSVRTAHRCPRFLRGVTQSPLGRNSALMPEHFNPGILP